MTKGLNTEHVASGTPALIRLHSLSDASETRVAVPLCPPQISAARTGHGAHTLTEHWGGGVLVS